MWGSDVYAMVEHRGLEPLTPTLPVWCAPNCANAPWDIFTLLFSAKMFQNKTADSDIPAESCFLVRVTGLEPARPGHRILSPARLPIPPHPPINIAYYTL